MKITDEMIENAEFAFADAWAQRTGAIRAALNAVAPLIRAEALEEAARVADAVAAALPPRACRSTCCYLS